MGDHTPLLSDAVAAEPPYGPEFQPQYRAFTESLYMMFRMEPLLACVKKLRILRSGVAADHPIGLTHSRTEPDAACAAVPCVMYFVFALSRMAMM
jgi:hypothetical protein